MLRVAAYTGGVSDPSARFRVRQYIPALRRLGVDVRERPCYPGSYPPSRKALRPFWAMAALGERLFSSARSYQSDLTLLQRPMLSTLVTAEPFTRRPRILDVDDAIWLARGGIAARRLARLCDAVICGNDYLAEHFSQWNQQVRVLPTAIDTDRFHPGAPREPGAPRIIGWSGSSSGFRFLYPLVPSLKVILNRRRDVRLRVMAQMRPALDGLPESQVEFIPWSGDAEVRAIQGMTVGLMPLEDTPWTRGKCSFKLLSYMACAVPAVASPVGMNAQVLRQGGGLAAGGWDDWTDAIESLLSNETRASEIGERGRQVAYRNYSVQTLAPRLARILSACSESIE